MDNFCKASRKLIDSGILMGCITKDSYKFLNMHYDDNQALYEFFDHYFEFIDKKISLINKYFEEIDTIFEYLTSQCEYIETINRNINFSNYNMDASSVFSTYNTDIHTHVMSKRRSEDVQFIEAIFDKRSSATNFSIKLLNEMINWCDLITRMELSRKETTAKLLLIDIEQQDRCCFINSILESIHIINSNFNIDDRLEKDIFEKMKLINIHEHDAAYTDMSDLVIDFYNECVRYLNL